MPIWFIYLYIYLFIINWFNYYFFLWNCFLILSYNTIIIYLNVNNIWTLFFKYQFLLHFKTFMLNNYFLKLHIVILIINLTVTCQRFMLYNYKYINMDDKQLFDFSKIYVIYIVLWMIKILFFKYIFRTKELYVLLGLAVTIKVDALASYVYYVWVVRASKFISLCLEQLNCFSISSVFVVQGSMFYLCSIKCISIN